MQSALLQKKVNMPVPVGLELDLSGATDILGYGAAAEGIACSLNPACAIGKGLSGGENTTQISFGDETNNNQSPILLALLGLVLVLFFLMFVFIMYRYGGK